jgi:hypothetical protein
VGGACVCEQEQLVAQLAQLHQRVQQDIYALDTWIQTNAEHLGRVRAANRARPPDLQDDQSVVRVSVKGGRHMPMHNTYVTCKLAGVAGGVVLRSPVVAGTADPMWSLQGQLPVPRGKKDGWYIELGVWQDGYIRDDLLGTVRLPLRSLGK